MSNTCIVTGASGHIGGNLLRLLLARGFRVRALVHRDARAISGLDVETCMGDVLDPGSLGRAFEGASFAFHLAAQVSVLRRDSETVTATNMTGTRNVVEACLEKGIKRLVHFSSIHAFNPHPASEPLDETRDCLNDKSPIPYDRSKASAEKEVLSGVERGLDAVIVNPTAVIGPHDYKPSYLGEVFERLVERRLPAVVDAGFDWVDVRDVCAGALGALEKGRTGERYLLSGHWLNFRELAEILSGASGVPAPGFTSPLWLAEIGAAFMPLWSKLSGSRPLFSTESLLILKTSNCRISCEKARRELGYAPRPISETVRDWWLWYSGQRSATGAGKAG